MLLLSAECPAMLRDFPNSANVPVLTGRKCEANPMLLALAALIAALLLAMLATLAFMAFVYWRDGRREAQAERRFEEFAQDMARRNGGPHHHVHAATRRDDD
jgi:hypothetical protein